MRNHLEKFDPTQLSVVTGTDWVVTVRKKQITYGDLVILPNQNWSSFANVSSDGWSELREILAYLEQESYEKLKAQRVNVVAAMMKDPFVHFHFFPRYEHPIERLGQAWVDEGWPKVIEFRDVETSSDVLKRIRDDLSEAFDPFQR